MNATTRISAKGQVVIPKSVRDELGLAPGQTLDVITTGAGILLRPAATKGGESFEVITARIRARVHHEGPPVTLAEMDDAIAQMWVAGGPRWDE